MREEVVSGIMSCCGLRYLVICTRFDGVDEIRELNSVLDEENRDVVSNDV